MKNLNRETAILLTAASAILCACPGLVMCSSSLIVMLASTEAPNSDAAIVQGLSSGVLCIGVLLVLIPAAVGYFTLRPSRLEEPVILEDTGKAKEPVEPDEPIPPAI
jgi:tellurite resistance protein TehA-like permease